MRSQVVLPCVVAVLVAVPLLVLGGDLANIWTISDALDCTKTAAACEDERLVGIGLLVTGIVAIDAVIGFNILWAARRATRRRLRESGTRVPAELVRSKRVGKSSEGSVHFKQWWRAWMPDGTTRDFVVRSGEWLQNGYLLEAATDGEKVALVLELQRNAVARDRELVFASHQAARELRRHVPPPITATTGTGVALL